MQRISAARVIRNGRSGIRIDRCGGGGHRIRQSSDKRYFLKEVTAEDIGPEDDDSSELSAKQRQWMQVDFFQKSKAKPYFDAEHFAERSKIGRWRPPFHFIDFETLTSAIPFHKGTLPKGALSR